ncbi:hypothetical protein HYX19_01830, partial [Candidatus Woesearchaeota archaeon]|nr:hypothetical protein [Candidatus Woesearchaeota archaeon]
TLTMNSTLNQTFNNTDTYTPQYILISNLTKGKYYWNVSCADTLNRINTSETFLTKLGYLPPAITTINEIYRNGKERIFELVIQNNATKFMENISWTFDTGENVVINSTLPVILNYSELTFIYIPFTYSDNKLYNITAKASYNADPNESLNVTYTATSDVRIFNISSLKTLSQNFSRFIFEYRIINAYGNNNSASNWSFDTNGQVITSNLGTILNTSENVMVFIDYNYTSYGSFMVTVSGIPEQYTKPASITVDNKKLELNSLQLLSNNLTSVTEFIIKNKFNVNISDVSWVYRPNNITVTNSTQNSNLIANETVLVYVQYTYNTSGSYIINATTGSVSESAQDSMIKTITI